MVDLARYIALEQIERAPVCQPIERLPELVMARDLFETYRSGLRSRLEHPGRGNRVCEIANLGVIEQPHELRNRQSGELGSGSHGQLVAEITSGGFSHSRNAHVFAQGSSGLKIEI